MVWSGWPLVLALPLGPPIRYSATGNLLTDFLLANLFVAANNFCKIFILSPATVSLTLPLSAQPPVTVVHSAARLGIAYIRLDLLCIVMIPTLILIALLFMKQPVKVSDLSVMRENNLYNCGIVPRTPCINSFLTQLVPNDSLLAFHFSFLSPAHYLLYFSHQFH